MPEIGDIQEKNGRVYVFVQPDASLGPGVWRTANPDEIAYPGGGGTPGLDEVDGGVYAS